MLDGPFEHDIDGLLYNPRVSESIEAALPGETRLRDGGAVVVQEPADQPWGERTAIVTDPDGDRVIVGFRG